MNPHPSSQTLQHFVSGALSNEESQQVLAHLAVCQICNGQIATLRTGRQSDSLSGSPNYPSNPSIQTSVATTSASPPGSRDSDSSLQKSGAVKPIDLPRELIDHPQYKVIKQIGRGGMGVLYLVQHRVTARQEALKIIHPHLLNNPGVKERFLREIQTAARLNHPNVVRTLNAVAEGDLLGLVMEYTPGETLQRLVKRIGPLATDRVLDFIAQAAEGLVHAQDQGMVHRDIKPANLMITRESDRLRLRILDFGLARSTFDTEEQRQMTQTDSILGTPEYIAPEQALNPSKADIRADIYSLGCCMYFALTGVPPCTGETTLAILHAHLNGDVKPLSELRPDLPKSIAQLQQLMMQKSVEKRFQTPSDLLAAIRKVQKHLADLADVENQPPPPASEPKQNDSVSQTFASTANSDKTNGQPPNTTSVFDSPPATPAAVESSASDLFTALSAAPARKGQNAKSSPGATKKPTRAAFSKANGSSLWAAKVSVAGRKIGMLTVVSISLLLVSLIVGLLVIWMRMDASSPDDATILIADLPADVDVFVNGKRMSFQLEKDSDLLFARTPPGVTIISFQRAGKEVNKQQVRLIKQQRATIKPNLLVNNDVMPSLNEASPENANGPETPENSSIPKPE